MPLLGTLWEDNYKVLDPDHIDAELGCKWASAHEVISRVGSRPGKDLAVEETASLPVKDLEGVATCLRKYRDWYEAVRDPRAVFTHAYATITEIFKKEIPQRQFNDRDWIVSLDIAFAGEYFRALDAYDLGEEIPGGWRPVFTAIREGRTSVLEELILSMAAHIIHDLPLALREVKLTGGDRSRIHDFYLANEVLEHGIDQIQQTVARRYNLFLAWLDNVGLREDEILTNYGIRLSRATAWFNSERLSNPETERAALVSIVKSSEVVVQQLLSPPLLSLRIFPEADSLDKSLDAKVAWPPGSVTCCETS